MHLQQQLKELEDNVAYARRDYNVMTETFPSNLVAAQFRSALSDMPTAIYSSPRGSGAGSGGGSSGGGFGGGGGGSW